MPQKSGTKWAQEVWQVRAHSVTFISMDTKSKMFLESIPVHFFAFFRPKGRREPQ